MIWIVLAILFGCWMVAVAVEQSGKRNNSNSGQVAQNNDEWIEKIRLERAQEALKHKKSS